MDLSFFLGGIWGWLDGDTVLDEGRVQVGVGQCQTLVPLLDVPRDLGQAALKGSDALPRGLLCEVLIWVGAQGPLVLGLLANQPEEEEVVTADVHFREGV